MKVVFVSSLMSKRKNDSIFENANEKPLQSIQKFNRMLCKGLVCNNVNVQAISSIPMSRKIIKKMFWFEKSEFEDGIEYTYIPFLNIRFVRQFLTFIFSIFIISKKIICSDSDTFVIVDVLNTTIATVSNILCKIFGVKCIGLVTDLPRDINSKSVSSKINQFFQQRYDGYIVLTEKMNEIVNTKRNPSIVVEGFSDINMKKFDNEVKYKNTNKICIYAGGLYEKYGVLSLIKAFEDLNLKNCELHLYGYGELEKYLSNIKTKKIKFFGMIPNDVLIKKEIEATLLINPRFTENEYTKYSFPSKNIEYMSTGTPVLTTNLPGMPTDYKDYVFLFEDESVNGFTKKLNEILQMSSEKLHKKGLIAKKFVLKEKNNIVQGKKIKDWISKNLKYDNSIIKRNFNFINLVLSVSSMLLLLLANVFTNVNLGIFSLTLLFLSNFLYSIINFDRIGILSLFLISFFTFSMGQYYFNNIDDFMYYKYFPNNIVVKTITIQTISLFSICLVFYIINLFGLKKKKSNFYKFDHKLNFFHNITVIGFLITILCAFIVNIEAIIRVAKYGYLVLYNGQHPSMIPNPIHYLSNSIPVFLIISLVSTKDKNKIRFILFIYFINLLLSLFTGARSEFVIGMFFIAFFILRAYNYTEIFCKKTIKKFFIVLIMTLPSLIIALNVYNRLRNKVSVSEINPTVELASFFVSQGRSINLLNYGLLYEKNLTNEQTNYTFGILYDSLDNKVKILSFGKLALPDINVRKSNYAIDISITVLGMDKYKQGNGLGTSYLPELYLDFGLFGVIIFSLLFAMIIGLLNYFWYKNYIVNALSLLMFNSIMFLTRGQALEFVCSLTSFSFWFGIVGLNILYYLKNKLVLKGENI